MTMMVILVNKSEIKNYVMVNATEAKNKTRLGDLNAIIAALGLFITQL